MDSGANGDGGGDTGDAGTDASIQPFSGPAVEHGIMLDYTSLMPVAGVTVTDHGASAMTDANGVWSIAVPPNTPLLSPLITFPKYGPTYFPEAVPVAADIDFGANVFATASLFGVAQSGLGNDMTKGLAYIVVYLMPSCPSAVGGTIKLLAPSGTSTVYFSSDSLPDNTVKSFQAVDSPRPVAVVFNIPLGADLSIEMSHPTCTQVPFPFMRDGRMYDGKVPIVATEPGDYSSALVLMLQ